MFGTVVEIPLINLAVGFVPVLLVIGVLWKWSMSFGNASYAVVRMLLQLLLIGFVLTYIFESDRLWVVALVLAVMLSSASWIALRTVGKMRTALYAYALFAIFVGGGTTLAFVTQGVLRLDPWFNPQYLVPLAGMIFANAMNSVSLAAERFFADSNRGEAFEVARKTAYRAALIPIVNSLLAVGLVALPGMMTGQILSGVSPLIAVRYQIVVMCMIFASAGISAAVFLILLRRISRFRDNF